MRAGGDDHVLCSLPWAATPRTGVRLHARCINTQSKISHDLHMPLHKSDVYVQHHGHVRPACQHHRRLY